jgi:Tfp pilus tip-associated adhesin PilY1
MAPTSSVADQGGSLTWNNELAYLSVIQSAPDKNLLCLKSASEVDEFLDPNNPNDFCPNSGDKYSNYGYMDKGGIWRLRMNGAPSSWQNQLKVFYNAERPISGAVNTTYDATGRLWVFFGSGRYFSSADSHLCEGPGNTKECRLNHVNYLYGIREPVNGAGELTYQQVYETNLMDVSNIFVYPSGSIQSKTSDGSLGTFTVDSIEVKDYEHLSELIAQPSSDGYRRAMATGFGAFVDSTEVDNPYKPGSENTDWWKGMSSEMILEQVALVPHGLNGSAMAFSTFLPESATCGSVGRGITMMVDTFTGLPKPIFGSDRYIELNHFLVIGEQNGENENYVTGYVAPAAGKHTQTVVTVTGTNENRKIGFMTNHTGGSGDSLGFPDEDVPQGGVVSWREVLDFSNLEIEP